MACVTTEIKNSNFFEKYQKDRIIEVYKFYFYGKSIWRIFGLCSPKCDFVNKKIKFGKIKSKRRYSYINIKEDEMCFSAMGIKLPVLCVKKGIFVYLDIKTAQEVWKIELDNKEGCIVKVQCDIDDCIVANHFEAVFNKIYLSKDEFEKAIKVKKDFDKDDYL